jgi:hypothetical protein
VTSTLAMAFDPARANKNLSFVLAGGRLGSWIGADHTRSPLAVGDENLSSK